MEAAVDDALAVTATEFGDAADGDRKTEAVSTLYPRVAGFHCAYRE